MIWSNIASSTRIDLSYPSHFFANAANLLAYEGDNSSIRQISIEYIDTKDLHISSDSSAAGKLFTEHLVHEAKEEGAGAADCAIEGKVDILMPWGASGWARYVDGRNEFVQVEALINGVVIGKALARDSRQDDDDDDSERKPCGFTFQFEKLVPADVDLTIRAVHSNRATILFCGRPIGIEGYVDSVAKWGASGWARMVRNIDGALRVEARRGDRVIASAIANQLREDVLASGRGTGRYGFTLKFAPPLPAGAAPDFFAIGNGETLRLSGSKTSVLEIAPETTSPEAAPVAKMETSSTPSLDIEGSVDTVTRWFASGWVWSPSAPKQSLEVDAFLNGEVISRATANQFRPDLARHKKGSGHCGFVMSFSCPLENETPPIFRVVGPEGPVIISNPNKIVVTDKGPAAAAPEEKAAPAPAPPAPPPLAVIEGHVDDMTRQGASGWAWFPAAPEQTVQVEAMLDGKVIGRALANQLRPDLAQHGKGTGLYGYTIEFSEPVSGATAPEIRALPALGACCSTTRLCRPSRARIL